MEMHLINLDRSPERLQRFHEENPNLSSLTRFSAIEGNAVNKEALIENGILMPENRYSPGALGCALSHATLWRRAFETSRTITVIEDDAILSPEFERICANLVKGLPHTWDIIMWSYVVQTFLWVELLPGHAGAEIRWDMRMMDERIIEHFRNFNMQRRLVKLLHQFGTACYSISPKGAKLMSEGCLPLHADIVQFHNFPIRIENEGIDCAMNAVYPNIEAYVAIPPLAFHDTRLRSTIK